MKKNTQKNFNEIYNPLFKWCPLFGALPSLALRDGVSEKCLRNIEEARSIMGSWEYSSGIDSPEPERIEASTRYPVGWIAGARILVHMCSAHEILFDAQFRQGLYRDGRGWVEGRNESYLQIDVDQIDPDRLITSIRVKVVLPQEFKNAFIDDSTKPPRKRNYPIITSEKIFALMAISVSWYLFKNITNGSIQPKSDHARDYLLTAEKLLKRANKLIAGAQQKSLEELEMKNPWSSDKQRSRVITRHEKEIKLLKDRNDKLINEAEAILLKGKKGLVSSQAIYNALRKNKQISKILTMKHRQFSEIIRETLIEHKKKHKEEIDK